MSNFDKTFEMNKSAFRQKFGIEWNTNPQLYLTYVQTVYTASLLEVANNGMSQLLGMQKQTFDLLQHISKEQSKK